MRTNNPLRPVGDDSRPRHAGDAPPEDRSLPGAPEPDGRAPDASGSPAAGAAGTDTEGTEADAGGTEADTEAAKTGTEGAEAATEGTEAATETAAPAAEGTEADTRSAEPAAEAEEPAARVGRPAQGALPDAATVLSAVSTGVWRWDEEAGLVTLDAQAARLVGLPARAVTMPSANIRPRFHPVDWNELDSVSRLAITEGTVAEVRLRIMDDRNHVIRVVRARCMPFVDAASDSYEMTGTLQEVTGSSPGLDEITGDWRRSREAFLLDAGRALAEARSTAEVLRVAAGLSMPGFSPDGLAVFGTEGDRMVLVGHHGHKPGDMDPFMEMPLASGHPAAEVIRTGHALYISPEEYQRRYPGFWPLARRFKRGAWAVMPLTSGGRTLGAWLAAFTNPVQFTPDERSVLTTVARMLGQALFRAGAEETQKELTEGLQRSMMPDLGPRVPGLGVSGRYVPTGGGMEVGGDWYDVITLPTGRIALVIGDVQGHDVRAAGLMGQLRIALRAYAAEGHSPDAVLSRANRFLADISSAGGSRTQGGSADNGGGDDDYGVRPAGGPAHPADDRFATCLYVEVDPSSGTLTIARAGHLDPVVHMPDGTTLLRPTTGGLPLGIDEDADFPITHLVLEPGETMLLCTDGLAETGGHDLLTGWGRIKSLLETYGPQDLETLADTLIEAVHGPASHHTTGPYIDRRDDDIALMLLRRTGEPLPGQAARRTTLAVAQAEPERIAQARTQLRELLHDWPDREQVDSAELLVSELLANVLRHTDGDARLVAEVTGIPGQECMRVEVTDSSIEPPHRRRPGELASSGRGLLLIEYLANSWGVAPRGDGKTIWFELNESEEETEEDALENWDDL
ncbi:SpoIIE family protein phosphatase [Streptomyces sp. TS71-3]|uniref:ATP-binding SpoIIE family protein phosphatase n=1 Tax=Streptomyces sp. TS71-3 TaxID=2733862 RepID=UPI001B265D17|nr:SpoIIE family protein phosphatase [Streptomyces sp. TS71-3]GHJ40354.1 magnesium or manganese-dependent protein phosphatase [Streptomyces sp. TS71-3]